VMNNLNSRVKQAKLSLEDIEGLTKTANKIPKDILTIIQDTFPAMARNADIGTMDKIYSIIINCFGHRKYFESQFLNDLIQIVSTKNQYFNQKILDNLIRLFSKIHSTPGPTPTLTPTNV